MADDFSSQVERYRNLIDAALLDIGKNGEPAYLYEPIRYVLSGKGKRLRPSLVFISADAFGASENEALPAAMAVEILHNFSLVHDDIMDGDDLRHGKETVHKHWDDSVAILAGDGIFSLAYDQLTRLDSAATECLKVFSKATLRLCEGQALDKDFESHKAVSVDDYLEMVRLKTGTLLSLCCRLGAIVGSASADQTDQAGRFGERVGQAFQIQDDILEIYSNSDNMGKSLGSDVLAGKKTFLTCSAEEENASQWSEFRTGLGGGDLSEEILPALRQYFRDNGIQEAGKERVKQLVNEALSFLENIPKNKREKFELFVQMVIERKH